MTTIPESINCCITQQLMRDPVQSPRGHSYEKAAIEDWISRNGTSPMTRDTLTKTDLRPNLALKDGIDSLLKSNPELLINKDSKEQVMKKRSPANLVSNILFEKGKLLVSHQVEYSNEEAAPCDITACIDVSGSMGGDASLKNTSGISENTGL